MNNYVAQCGDNALNALLTDSDLEERLMQASGFIVLAAGREGTPPKVEDALNAVISLPSDTRLTTRAQRIKECINLISEVWGVQQYLSRIEREAGRQSDQGFN